MATLTVKHKPYSVYKPSGVEWLGDVPSHWEVKRLKDSVTDCVGGVWGSEPNDLDDLPCVRVADFDRNRLRVHMHNPTLRAIAPNDRRRRVLNPDDLLLEKSGGGDLQPVGVVMLYDQDALAVCSNFIARLRIAVEFDPVFLTFLHSAIYAIRLNTRSIKQTTGIQNLDIPAYLRELVCFPPLAEQRAIATFLDRETTKIDALVSKKERLIELLQEKRTALISHTVTKGLDPNVPMKDSGVEWLGDVPAHWEVQRVKWVADLNPSRTEERAYLAADTPVTFLPMERVGTEGQTDTSEKVGASQVWNGYTYFRRGDILVAKITPCFENGKGAYLNSLPTEVGFGSTEFHVLRAKPSAIPRFLYLLTTDIAFRRCGTESMTGAAGQQRVSADFVAKYQIPLPPLAEQCAIAAFLDQETAKLDNLIAKVQNAIELLKELRTGLISAAVTGKIDVREETVCT